MSELKWLDKVEQLSTTWKDRCNLIPPTTNKYMFSRIIFEAVWRLNEWDLKILRECLKDNRDWTLFEAHQRLKLEGMLRAYWVEECATDDRLKKIIVVDKDSSLESQKLVTREKFPSVHKIISELKRKNVPYINQHSKTFISLYEGANDSAHMSLRLILTPLVERKVWPEIKECLFQVGICALRISRISSDKHHASIIENELMEVLRQFDSQFQ